MSETELSIIIVNYKSWIVLQQCLDSFTQHKPKLSYEIIVVDNDSQDGKFEQFSQSNPQITLIKNSGNHGFSHGCNLGAKNARGNYLLFLNPDVVLTESPAIDVMVEFAKKSPGIGIVSCRTINPKGKPEREIAFLNPWLSIGWLRSLYRLIFKHRLQQRFPNKENIWHPDWIAGSVVTIHRDFFNQIGGWSEQHFWMYFEDPDLCQKARETGKEVALLRHVELKHAHGGSSRRNPKTTAITKSEVVTSGHVFVQIYTSGFNRIALQVVMVMNTLSSWILRTLATSPLFWRPAFQANYLTLTTIMRYYWHALIRRSWKSKRLASYE